MSHEIILEIPCEPECFIQNTFKNEDIFYVGNKIGKDKMKNGCSFPRIIPAYACIQLL
jgi:hypothetical protein